ncbi:MAG: hypothetical protein ACT4N5_05020 [Nitrosopumilaceae archaeon]
MDLEETILSELVRNSTKHEYRIHYRNQIYLLEDVVITKSAMPVNRPTTRGGVYSVGDTEYKIKGTTHDMSLLLLISKMMLGPNEEFQKIPVQTNIEIEKIDKSCTLFTYLTDAMNNSSKIVLNLLIIGTKIE